MSKVYLVGAGPGDPELLTLKGRRVLEHADSVLYDHLASSAILDFAPACAERLYVGKKRSEHAYSQAEIISLMVERARAGRAVVRLKGGDPFIFGRGGEEVEALGAAGIAYEVVPGVTAPLGIAAYTGVPLTHREHTSVVTFVTGHDLAAVNWANVSGAETLVIFMGLQHLSEIVSELIAAGRSPLTPAMAVQWGTRPNQRTVMGTLADLPERVAAAHLAPPATVIIGAVVSLRGELSWYERLPLFGKRVIVTRARAQSAELNAALHALAADVIELPVIEMAPPADSEPLRRCISKLEEYDWVVFTGANAVEFFLREIEDLRRLRARICAIGPATAKALRDARIGVDLLPSEHVAEGVANAFGNLELRGRRVLFPRGASAREVVPSALEALGAIVDAPETYRNVIPRDAESHIQQWLKSGAKADWITFTSPSTVKNFVQLAGAESLSATRVVTIGPTTSEAARKHGLAVHAQADTPTVAGLVDAITKGSL